MTGVLDQILAPLARLAVARGVVFSDLMERLKGHYVRAAMQLAEGKPTDSRLSVMTGLQRRDIARLKEFKSKPRKPNPLTRLVALWQTDKTYAPGGTPLPLPRSGDAPSFDSLARAIRQDVHPRTFLDALEAAGTVRISADDSVQLIETAYVPLGDVQAQMAYLADNVGDHLCAATDNVLGRDPAHFERAVHYGGLTPEQIEILADRFHAGQMMLLEELSREASAMKATAPTGATARFRAGGYVYSTQGDDE
ncbi:DUF6502 family protein [Alisedimentitalea sp. MJ-SS2]|uniref:DUF6502 family protein n=1 Tax=Aliisedimentitalea sp. MJ-SS2 TaxID=3049795 RepID=UPI002906C610|nr:DUF6502 family protein [Alisedimentitalea sp. MJ-SS2]MDU8928446.1 DUF6502 family protein [Alisedimentitalea sp. MJ-SS2]